MVWGCPARIDGEPDNRAGRTSKLTWLRVGREYAFNRKPPTPGRCPGKGTELTLLASHSSKFDFISAEDVSFQNLYRTLLLRT